MICHGGGESSRRLALLALVENIVHTIECEPLWLHEPILFFPLACGREFHGSLGGQDECGTAFKNSGHCLNKTGVAVNYAL